MKLQQSISRKAKQQWVGREVLVLAEGESEETPMLWEGRTEFHAPEIDGKVYINDFGDLEISKPAVFIAPKSPRRTTTIWWHASSHRPAPRLSAKRYYRSYRADPRYRNHGYSEEIRSQVSLPHMQSDRRQECRGFPILQ